MSDGIVDCHVHVIGSLNRFPQEAERYYTAAVATTGDRLKSTSGTGVRRFVVVRPRFYGTDNRATLDAVATLGEAGCSVAVVDAATVTDDALRTLHAQRVRGLRINLNTVLPGDARQLSDEIVSQGDIARQMGWYLQLVVPFDSLRRYSDVIANVPVLCDMLTWSTRHQGATSLRYVSQLGARFSENARSPSCASCVNAALQKSSTAFATPRR